MTPPRGSSMTTWHYRCGPELLKAEEFSTKCWKEGLGEKVENARALTRPYASCTMNFIGRLAQRLERSVYTRKVVRSNRTVPTTYPQQNKGRPFFAPEAIAAFWCRLSELCPCQGKGSSNFAASLRTSLLRRLHGRRVGPRATAPNFPDPVPLSHRRFDSARRKNKRQTRPAASRYRSRT